MRKKKKRLQMQRETDEQAMRRLLDESVALGLLEHAGTNEKGEPLYRISPNAEAKADVLRRLNGLPPQPK
jgi:hypothetical protein